MERIGRRRGITGAQGRGLDIGCGAGLSTVPLGKLTDSVVGVDPVLKMVSGSRKSAGQVTFLVAQAEAQPFKAGSFDLITAAGSLNYSDIDLSLAEVSRVLKPSGMLAIYDFGSGRHFREGAGLDSWFTAFEQRYPFPPGYELEVRALPFSQFGLSLEACEEFQLALAMDLDSYLRYVMTETSVEQAISEGTPEAEIGAWCLETLQPLFGSQPREILFPAYIAYVGRR